MKRRILIVVLVVLCFGIAGYLYKGYSPQTNYPAEQLIQLLKQELNVKSSWPTALKLNPPHGYAVYGKDRALERGLEKLLDNGLAEPKGTRIVLSKTAKPDEILATAPELKSFLAQQAQTLSIPKTSPMKFAVATSAPTPTATTVKTPSVTEEQSPESEQWSIPPLMWQIPLALLGAAIAWFGMPLLGAFIERKKIERDEKRALPIMVLTGEALVKQQRNQLIVQRVLIVAAIATVLSPIDLIPDLIPIIGWVDDAISFLFLVKKILEFFAEKRGRTSKQANEQLIEHRRSEKDEVQVLEILPDDEQTSTTPPTDK